MAKDKSEKYEEALQETYESHNSISFFGVLMGLSAAWVLLLVTLSNKLNIDEVLPSLTLSPTLVIMFSGMLSIYSFVNWLNRRSFSKKYVSTVVKTGLSETEVQAYITKREIENLILRGDLHGNLKKNIARRRQEYNVKNQ